ncbi:MAG: RagB/SusD family nutrient uptake outer membrane protein [Muribaculaceae bacterium]|nr:RagB/SusD family nutrient uptake outer membrane protein [Muribaculaceae bacterium]
MKTIYIKSLAALLLAGSLTSCGDKFLETDMFGQVDSNTALNNVANIGYALNGTYYALSRNEFAGTEATAWGDIASDVTYWNQKTSHFNDLYQYQPLETSVLLKEVWEYGYKVIDNATRIIKASEALAQTITNEEDLALLDRYTAEAHALRAYAELVLVNGFAHQIKVDGKDFSNEPGIVLVSSPVSIDDRVSRSTIGETYAAIERNLENALNYFDEAGDYSSELVYFTPAAVKGLQARVYLYQEKWTEAAAAAKEALELAGIDNLVDTPAEYKALYNGGDSNVESLFFLAIDQQNNWSANSSGTLWSTYSYSPSPWLSSIMAEDDCRRAVWGPGTGNTSNVPVFNGGKFMNATGNAAVGTCYLINAPEMFLIQAEAALQQGNLSDAADYLLVVAKRNPAIASVADLPSDKDALYSFIKEERARELFQEGHRLWDLRRWGKDANVYATGAPNVNWTFKNFKVSECVYPIPDYEINTGAGVTQNVGWQSTFPNL